jgi:hypothetical protein
MLGNSFPDPPVGGSMASFDISYNYRSSTKIINHKFEIKKTQVLAKTLNLCRRLVIVG